MTGTQNIIMSLHAAASRQLEQARQLEKEGHLKQAAAAVRKAAGYIREMAEKEIIQTDRVRRYRKAKEAEELARKLEQGKKVFSREQVTSSESMPAVDEYKASVDELQYRANITWDDIGGMEEVKSSLKYTFGLLLAQMPEDVSIESSSRILLYGPPGTGKTLLAAACSNMLGATFFNVKASDLLSKYFGESTKLISALYSRARDIADTGAAMIFIDEFDSLCMARGGAGETGAERRILSTLLAELDGLAEKGEASRVFTIAATNRPWNMDDAILDRFERHVLVDLPDVDARNAIFKIHTLGNGFRLDGITHADLARLSKGYSGRHIKRVCKHAQEQMVMSMNSEVPKYVDMGRIRDYKISCRPLNKDDFLVAFRKVRPISNEESVREFSEWAARIGGERA